MSKKTRLSQCLSFHGLNVTVICLKKSGTSKLPRIDSTTVLNLSSVSI
nr:MAG TPA: hypothetical protein [Caudoviricetes sp.]